MSVSPAANPAQPDIPVGRSMGGSPRRRWLKAAAWIALSAALAGGVIACYLAFENVRGETGVCTGVAKSCATVQKSQYGEILGVPVSVPGLALYVTLVALAGAWLLDFAGRRPMWAALGFQAALFGFVFSMYLTSVEAFVLDAWCVYCVASASLMTASLLAWGALLFGEVRHSRAEAAGTGSW